MRYLLRFPLALLLGVALALPVAAQEPCGEMITVAPGDTLSAIARRCDTTLADLLQANPAIVNPDLAFPGMELAMPTGVGGPEPEPQTYLLRSEETLAAIAERFGTTVEAILEANPGIANPNLIVVGQQLAIAIVEPATFTSVRIPLIEIGTGDLGCDDRLVWVEREVGPIQAPLTAALLELLTISDGEVGALGYYNSLAGGDLQIDRVHIAWSRATIALSGELFGVGGVCDPPRIEAQFEGVATQFETVDAVDVFVSGEPLAELLDLS